MWKYIESASKLEFKKVDVVWSWMPISSLVITILAFSIWNNKGFPSRYSAEFTMTDEEILYNRKKYWRGTAGKEILNGSNDETAIVVGNSFGIDLIYALRKSGLEANIVSLQSSHRCFNFSASAVNEEDTQFCETVRFNTLKSEHWAKADVVYLFDHWPKSDFDNLKKFLNKIRTLTKAPIYVLGPKMVFTKPIPHIVHSCRSASTTAINKFAQDFAKKKDRNEINDSLIRFFEDENFEEKSIFFINVLKVLRNDENNFDIISRENSDFLYFDPSHFTDQGAKEFGEKLKKTYPELFNFSQLSGG
jgi:hypothetical protein